MKKDICAFIFARGGSKGVPRKNVRLLGDKPLIAHAIETGLNSKYIDQIIVSTDDVEIAETAEKYGALVPFMRPDELAGDNASEWKAWQHAIKEVRKLGISNVDVFVSLPTTSPLRITEDIDRCIEEFQTSLPDMVVTATESNHHPAFNMIVTDEDNIARIAMPLDRSIVTRQSAPKIYQMTTVAYVGNSEFILNSNGIFEGIVKAVIIPQERAVDIDSELDFDFAEFLYSRKVK